MENDRLQARLLLLAGLFMVLYSAGLTLSPAARLQSWDVPLRWEHWLGTAAWAVVFFLVHLQTSRRLPFRDPYLVPAAALLTGWGLLEIYRLSPGFGLRQSIWLVVGGSVLVLGLRLPGDLGFLRRYKYLWLSGGLALTALTLIFGTNPSGGGLPRLWLGCCGVYFQPSEPLKLLLIIYLAAYLADRPALFSGLLSVLTPTLIMAGLALLLLGFQRDLGTATIFLYLYAVIVYLAYERKRVLAFSAAVLAIAGVGGYLLFGVVRARVDAWINPWADPSGSSYQIVQSLIAIANGGLIGRGPGLGNPGLVPVPHSDFIFSAIAEEVGLVGVVALLALIGFLAARSIRTALCAPDDFRRYLAAGLAAHLAGQSILIIGGNLRLLPLTGVTLPFVSYGGSSLLVAFLALLILLQIGGQPDSRPAPLPSPRPYLQLAGLLIGGLAVLALASGWWSVIRSPALLARTDNPRRAIADRLVKRGSLLDRNGLPLVESLGSPGSYERVYHASGLGAVIGYTNPVFGQTGLEASYDHILRGYQGNPFSLIWTDHLLYGLPPPGLNIRLALDLDLQEAAADAFAGKAGALAVVDAESGEIWALASFPSFDPARLEQDYSTLVADPRAPLFNRATLGQYPPGPSLGALMLADLSPDSLPPVRYELSYPLIDVSLTCAYPPPVLTWPAVIAAGCPRPLAELGKWVESRDRLVNLFSSSGLLEAPKVGLPAAGDQVITLPLDVVGESIGQGSLRVSPLQMAVASTVLSSNGIRPAPRLVLEVQTIPMGWTPVAPQGNGAMVFLPERSASAARSLAVEGQPIWQVTALASNGDQGFITWYLAGALPEGDGPKLVLALVLEENNPALAQEIGQRLLLSVVK